ncbi:MAG: hypothetical protein CME19_03435 [Gemmatimonadetes bacterium]|mgnify:FL=1|nr:hypothetical protein [Gemmatimonadota bacterium]
MIRIGLVGCGGIANRHINGYRRELMGRAEVVAGCDPNQETLDAIENDTEPPHSGRDNLVTMEIVDGAYLSAERREPVQIEELRVVAGVDA